MIILRFFFLLNTSRASFSTKGVTITSTKKLDKYSAVSRSNFGFTAMTEPKAALGSQFQASSIDCLKSLLSATPVGFVCLTTTDPLEGRDLQILKAASISR